MRGYLDTLAIYVPEGAIHINHSDDVVIGCGVAEQETIHQGTETQEETDGQQQTSYANNHDLGLQISKVQVFAGYAVISNLK